MPPRAPDAIPVPQQRTAQRPAPTGSGRIWRILGIVALGVFLLLSLPWAVVSLTMIGDPELGAGAIFVAIITWFFVVGSGVGIWWLARRLRRG